MKIAKAVSLITNQREMAGDRTGAQTMASLPVTI
jgi:hypothetical protein